MALEMQAPRATNGSPSQKFIQVDDIRSDCLVMQDGTLRAVVAVSSTNFDLKNQDEQDAIVASFQRFLNSLDFPIQILLQSRKLDIGEYTEKIRRLTDRQSNELLKIQAQTYLEFVEQLVENANVMTKNFYIIISYSQSISSSQTGFFGRLFGGGKLSATADRAEKLKTYGEVLSQRVNSVLSNLSGMGIRGQRLDTDGLVELLYNSYNFGAAPNLAANKLPEMQVKI